MPVSRNRKPDVGAVVHQPAGPGYGSLELESSLQQEARMADLDSAERMNLLAAVVILGVVVVLEQGGQPQPEREEWSLVRWFQTHASRARAPVPRPPQPPSSGRCASPSLVRLAALKRPEPWKARGLFPHGSRARTAAGAPMNAISASRPAALVRFARSSERSVLPCLGAGLLVYFSMRTSVSRTGSICWASIHRVTAISTRPEKEGPLPMIHGGGVVALGRARGLSRDRRPQATHQPARGQRGHKDESG